MVVVPMRFNPPPGWPPPPPGFIPDDGWRPDPSWPPAPAGWQLWVPDEPERDPATGLTPGYIGYGTAPAPAGYSQAPPPAGFGQAPGPAGYPQWAGWGPPALQQSGTDGMAIAGFVLGLLGILGISAILGIVFGSVALGRVRRTGQSGRGLAIAGVVLGSCWLALYVLLIVVGAVAGGGAGGASG
jgi:hypothetical protein